MIIKKNGMIAYVQSPFFRWCEHTIPYLPFIFKNKRQRVKCRQYFRYYHLRKINNILVKTLQKHYVKPFNPNYNLEDVCIEWDLINRTNI